jgi:hypothetical protein
VNLNFRIIPHRKQRYDTVGDYFKRDGVWQFRVSKMKDQRYSILVFLHEVIEFFLCRQAGIKMKDIDRFDKEYEMSRGQDEAACGCKHLAEPGDDPHAPYWAQHQAATKCERLIAEALGVKWSDYDAAIQQSSTGKR